MTKKPKKHQKQRFFGFGHFGQNGNSGSEIVNMSNKNPFWRGTPENFPLIGMGGVVFFEGSKNGPKMGRFSYPQKWRFSAFTFRRKNMVLTPKWVTHFWNKKWSKKWTRFWRPQKVRIYNFSFRSTRNHPKITFFHVFSGFCPKTPFLTHFCHFLGYGDHDNTQIWPKQAKKGQKQAKNRVQKGGRFSGPPKRPILNLGADSIRYASKRGSKSGSGFWPKPPKRVKNTVLDPQIDETFRKSHFLKTAVRP